ncbi:MAG: nitroreductase family protein [Sedimentisphaerales bacterium]|nr:nitroreductase family protein [Sedimentisphaerales bacterium]
MSILDIIQKRYSCRSYQEKEIEQDKLDRIFEAARLAPSAKNFQDWRFVVVTDKDVKNKIASVTNRPPLFEKAGAIIVACSNKEYIMQCGQAVGPIDVSIALEHISLQAAELGLATCWIGSFDAQKAKQLLNIPEDVTVIELMSLGYPAEKGRQNTRLAIEEILCYNKWNF